MAQIVWAPQALDDLEALIAYISRDAPQAAHRLAQQIVRRVESLAAHPLLGSVVPEDDSGTYRQVLQGNYRVIYRADFQQVIVLTVYHAARLLEPERLQ